MGKEHPFGLQASPARPYDKGSVDFKPLRE